MFLRFTDHEGDPLAVTADGIRAVYLSAKEKEEVASFPGRPVRTLVKVDDQYTVIDHSTGRYRVKDPFEDVMAKLEMSEAAESLSKEGYL